MKFVINIEDGIGQEYFWSLENRLVLLSGTGPEQPKIFPNAKEVAKQVGKLRPLYPPVCQIYALDWREFEARWAIIQAEITGRTKYTSGKDESS